MYKLSEQFFQRWLNTFEERWWLPAKNGLNIHPEIQVCTSYTVVKRAEMLSNLLSRNLVYKFHNCGPDGIGDRIKDTQRKPLTATYIYRLLTPVVLGRKIAVGCVQLSRQNFSYEIENIL
jgi:hypothetical protein